MNSIYEDIEKDASQHPDFPPLDIKLEHPTATRPKSRPLIYTSTEQVVPRVEIDRRDLVAVRGEDRVM